MENRPGGRGRRRRWENSSIMAAMHLILPLLLSSSALHSALGTHLILRLCLWQRLLVFTFRLLKSITPKSCTLALLMVLLRVLFLRAWRLSGLDSMVSQRWMVKATGMVLTKRLKGASSWQTPLSKGLPFIAPLFPEGTTAASLFVWSTVFFFFLTVLPTW